LHEEAQLMSKCAIGNLEMYKLLVTVV